jgi:hypothetical protein
MGYRVETLIEFTRVAIDGNVHYVPGSKLDEFLCVWGEQCGEVVIDVRPLTMAEALAELSAFRTTVEKGGA